MTQVDGETGLPKLGRHLIHPMPIIARGVVDQYPYGTQGVACGGDRAPQRFDVTHVAAEVVHSRTELVGERMRRRIGDIDEGDVATLRREAADKRGADARTAAGNEYRPSREVGITRAISTCDHRRSFPKSRLKHLYHSDVRSA